MKERDIKIIDLYENHPELTVKEIATQFNISTATISRLIKINNLPQRKGNNSKIKLTAQQINNFRKQYQSGQSLIQLQHKYHISYDRAKNLIKNEKKISSAKRHNPNLIENYFTVIDDNNKAYWLGWIISDGTINKNKYSLELTIKKQDQKILSLLEQDLQVQNKIYTSQKEYKRFALTCKNLILDLEKLGITQNKTFSVNVPNFDKQFNASFIRGLFDGDGGFCHYVRSNGQICNELSFCGNDNIISWVQKTLFTDIPLLKHNAITKESSIRRIRWSSMRDIILIRDYLYTNHNNHYLKRKHDLIYANTEVNS